MAGKHRKQSPKFTPKSIAHYFLTNDKPKSAIDDKHLKWRGHLVCILAGIAITVTVTYISSDIFAHILGPMCMAVPSIAQEAWDRIFSL